MPAFAPRPDAPHLSGEEETLDALGHGELRIIQPKRGFRYTRDALLLAGFARCKSGETVLDLGTGNGVIPLLLAHREATLRVIGVELDRESADRARRSVLLNRLEGRIDILHGDLRELRSRLPAQSCDVVIANPPYRRKESGRLAKGEQRSMARHELHGTLDDFLDAARHQLRNGGRFYVVYLPERLPELLAQMCARRIEPKRLRCVHAQAGEAATLVLVEGRRSGRPGLTVEAPLIFANDNVPFLF